MQHSNNRFFSGEFSSFKIFFKSLVVTIGFTPEINNFLAYLFSNNLKPSSSLLNSPVKTTITISLLSSITSLCFPRLVKVEKSKINNKIIKGNKKYLNLKLVLIFFPI